MRHGAVTEPPPRKIESGRDAAADGDSAAAELKSPGLGEGGGDGSRGEGWRRGGAGTAPPLS